MPHHNGHGNGHQKKKNGDRSLPETVSFGKNGSIPEGYDPGNSKYNPVGVSILLLVGLFGCGLITLIVLLFFQ